MTYPFVAWSFIGRGALGQEHSGSGTVCRRVTDQQRQVQKHRLREECCQHRCSGVQVEFLGKVPSKGLGRHSREVEAQDANDLPFHAVGRHTRGH
jgi:hypothetical protein